MSSKRQDVHLLADDHTLAAGGAGDVLILRLGGALRVIRGGAAGATAVELDAGAGAGDAVALAGAAGRDRGSGAWGAGTGAVEGWNVRVDVRVRVRVAVVLEVGGGELGGEELDGWGGELLGGDLAGLVWLDWHWALDAGWGESAALGDAGGALAAGLAVGRLGNDGTGLWGWDVEGVELAAGGGLGDGLAGWVVGDVVAVDDVVVPVALALLEGGTLEAEGTLPATSLGCVLGKGKLAVVVVPGAEEMDGLAVGGCAEVEVKLNSCHFENLSFGLCGLKKV